MLRCPSPKPGSRLPCRWPWCSSTTTSRRSCITMKRRDSGLKVILISEPGNQDSLSGCMIFCKRWKWCPPRASAARPRRSFTINAVSASVQSYAYAEVKDGMVKGYLAVWNPADAERMSRILPALKASFRGVGDKALDPGLGADGCGHAVGVACRDGSEAAEAVALGVLCGCRGDCGDDGGGCGAMWAGDD